MVTFPGLALVWALPPLAVLAWALGGIFHFLHLPLPSGPFLPCPPSLEGAAAPRPAEDEELGVPQQLWGELGAGAAQPHCPGSRDPKTGSGTVLSLWDQHSPTALGAGTPKLGQELLLSFLEQHSPTALGAETPKTGSETVLSLWDQHSPTALGAGTPKLGQELSCPSWSSTAPLPWEQRPQNLVRSCPVLPGAAQPHCPGSRDPKTGSGIAPALVGPAQPHCPGSRDPKIWSGTVLPFLEQHSPTALGAGTPKFGQELSCPCGTSTAPLPWEQRPQNWVRSCPVLVGPAQPHCPGSRDPKTGSGTVLSLWDQHSPTALGAGTPKLGQELSCPSWSSTTLTLLWSRDPKTGSGTVLSSGTSTAPLPWEQGPQNWVRNCPVLLEEHNLHYLGFSCGARPQNLVRSFSCPLGPAQPHCPGSRDPKTGSGTSLPSLNQNNPHSPGFSIWSKRPQNLVRIFSCPSWT
ncbi:uncharacterized protein LOC132338445 [Haemorhous mexicanus]|uniref:uncharacterized protein LOC132338445 n=1 Tax=Haemorhous mexicanus TaxID=30427 RepID=UPI0028BDCF0F|nr:uncharacterized protein LOC132338445 [Haemorhous mexicanus]